MGQEKDTEKTGLSLEETFEKLDGILNELESADISLEDSFHAYQEGMELLKSCNETIDAVEKKVLMLKENGGLKEFEGAGD